MARLRAIEFEKNYILEIATVCRGHHVYKKVWKPVTGENSLCIQMNWEEAQQYDDIYLCDDSKQVAGHLQIELSFIMSKMIFREACSLEFSPTGPRMLENGPQLFPQGTSLQDTIPTTHMQKAYWYIKNWTWKEEVEISSHETIINFGEVMLRTKMYSF